jgi:hypothetical protein
VRLSERRLRHRPRPFRRRQLGLQLSNSHRQLSDSCRLGRVRSGEEYLCVSMPAQRQSPPAQRQSPPGQSGQSAQWRGTPVCVNASRKCMNDSRKCVNRSCILLLNMLMPAQLRAQLVLHGRGGGPISLVGPGNHTRSCKCVNHSRKCVNDQREPHASSPAASPSAPIGGARSPRQPPPPPAGMLSPPPAAVKSGHTPPPLGQSVRMSSQHPRPVSGQRACFAQLSTPTRSSLSF